MRKGSGSFGIIMASRRRLYLLLECSEAIHITVLPTGFTYSESPMRTLCLSASSSETGTMWRPADLAKEVDARAVVHPVSVTAFTFTMLPVAMGLPWDQSLRVIEGMPATGLPPATGLLPAIW